MFALEYFYGLELLRPVLFLWTVPDSCEDKLPACPLATRRLWIDAAARWLPYLRRDVLFLAWRLTHSTPRGEVTLFKHLQLDPSATLTNLVRTIFYDIYELALVAWGRIFTYLNFGALKLNLVLAYAVIAILAALLVFVLLKLAQAAQTDKPAIAGLSQAAALGSAGAAGRPVRPADRRLAGLGDRFAAGAGCTVGPLHAAADVGRLPGAGRAAGLVGPSLFAENHPGQPAGRAGCRGAVPLCLRLPAGMEHPERILLAVRLAGSGA